jgi:hypothetical protein
MKSYPSVAASRGSQFRAFTAHVFDKIDGSNLRFEWSPKRGWYKFGTRKRLFDETDVVFGSAIRLWNETFAEPIGNWAGREHLRGCTAYAEFHGPGSFAGLHVAADPHQLTLIDLDIYKQGLIDPRDFVEFGAIVPTARYFGSINWTRGFVEAMYEDPKGAVEEYGNFHKGFAPTPSLEGVVGKAKTGRKRIMAKAKTKDWIEKVRELYAPDEAERIIQS